MADKTDLHRQIEEIAKQLVVGGDLRGVESRLSKMYRDAAQIDDREALELILPELAHLYVLMNDLAKAEEFSLRREQLRDDGYHRLQTAMFLYYAADDYVRAAAKLRLAIEKSEAEGDDSSLYTSLSLLGQSMLQLGENDEAGAILTRIEQMVAAKRRVVVGDETGFLEGLNKRGLELPRVKRLAVVLETRCRDAAFQVRLRRLQ